MSIYCFKREKTPKYTEKQTEKAKECRTKQINREVHELPYTELVKSGTIRLASCLLNNSLETLSLQFLNFWPGRGFFPMSVMGVKSLIGS